MHFYKSCHASISISNVSQRLKLSVTLSGLIAYYHKEIAASCWKPMMAPHFPPFFFSLRWSVRDSIKGPGVCLEWLHPGNTLASATVHDPSLFHHFEVLSFHSTSLSTLHSFHSLIHFRMEKQGAELITPCLIALFLTTTQPSFSSRAQSVMS